MISGARWKVKVIGVGRCGVLAVRAVADAGLPPSDLVAIASDAPELEASGAELRIQLPAGTHEFRDQRIGREGVAAHRERLEATLHGADVVFVMAGLGGATGSGGAPLLSELARSVGAVVIALVTTPFQFEGSRRRKEADAAISKLGSVADRVFALDNHRLLENHDLVEAFRAGDDALFSIVRSIARQEDVCPARTDLIPFDPSELRAFVASKLRRS